MKLCLYISFTLTSFVDEKVCYVLFYADYFFHLSQYYLMPFSISLMVLTTSSGQHQGMLGSLTFPQDRITLQMRTKVRFRDLYGTH